MSNTVPPLSMLPSTAANPDIPTNLQIRDRGPYTEQELTDKAITDLMQIGSVGWGSGLHLLNGSTIDPSASPELELVYAPTDLELTPPHHLPTEGGASAPSVEAEPQRGPIRRERTKHRASEPTAPQISTGAAPRIPLEKRIIDFFYPNGTKVRSKKAPRNFWWIGGPLDGERMVHLKHLKKDDRTRMRIDHLTPIIEMGTSVLCRGSDELAPHTRLWGRVTHSRSGHYKIKLDDADQSSEILFRTAGRNALTELIPVSEEILKALTPQRIVHSDGERTIKALAYDLREIVREA